MDAIKRNKRDFFFSYNIIFDIPMDSDIESKAKLVYLFLCRCADSDDKSFPSHTTIGKKCGIKSRTTVKKAIDTLMEFGLLDYKSRKTEKGGQTSNIYTIYDEPNKQIQRKYEKRKQKQGVHNSVQQIATPCSIKEQPPVQRMDTPCSIVRHPPVQQMDTPCSIVGHPPVQQMDTPCSMVEHEVYPSKYIHLKNIQSINQDGQIDSNKMDELFLAIGVEQLTHTENIKFMKMVLGNLLSTGRVGKITYPQYEILKTLRNLTPQKMDNVLDRYAIQSQKRRIPSPFEYIKTCVFSAGKDIATPLSTQAENQTDDHIPTYDMDEYTRLSMERLMGGQKGDDQKCPA